MTAPPQVADIYQERFQELWTDSANHHKFFQHASFSLTLHLGNFPGHYPSSYYFTASMLNCEFLKIGSRKRKCTFGDIGSRSNLFKLYLRCYNHPHLKVHIILIMPHKLTDLQVLLTGGLHPSIFALLGNYPGFLIHWRNLQLRVNFDTICNTSTLPQVADSYQEWLQGLSTGHTNHHKFVIHSRLHATWETSQEVNHAKLHHNQHDQL